MEREVRHLKKKSFGVVGYGKMGSSLVKGALNCSLLSTKNTIVYDLNGARIEVAKREGLYTVESLAGIVGSDSILLAVKPKEMPNLLYKLKALIPAGSALFISIAAGIKLASIESKLGEGSRVVRVVPNIAASVNEAVSVFVPNHWTRASDIKFVASLLKGIGMAYRLDNESMIDAVTGISSSGPAYFFLMMKALEDVGKRSGISDDLVRSLVSQTCKGAGTLALRSNDSFDQLIKSVASPGGITEKALRVMESKGFSQTVIEAVFAAIEKSKKMNYP
ncbi:MAG: pyrroline-5-carboxylate reductase [Candidatus Methanomethyliaceae archaeon]|nr:pyrroline-5-carboxylate reductase [Candidatus Methanomethyliaceae archaeon]